MDFRYWLGQALTSNEGWAETFGSFRPHPSLEISDGRFEAAFEELTERLKDNYPFFHPSYAGQMLKPPHPAAVVGYLAAMLVNPNNHALDGGPATAEMEREVVRQLATMFGYTEHLGHLTTSGTVANLEALFVARETHPGKGIAYSAEAHYTHGRMCGVLGVEGHTVPVDARGAVDLDALEDLLRTGKIGTVVLTAGTTALGTVEPVHEALALRERYGVRVHVDAAYGGFFRLLSGLDGPEGLPEAPWLAIAEADSIVIDPHKHGLQPYGCGAVLFKDPAAGRFYLHDSPYTYFTSEDLHLGEISLECSRAGAAAAALWLTFRVLPPTPDGLGRVLAAGRRAALRWAKLLEDSERFDLYQPPELDIVTYFPRTEPLSLSNIDQASARILRNGMAAAREPVFLSTLRVSEAQFGLRHTGAEADADGARILRSVLMKPESEDHVDRLHERLEELSRG
ncbi:pyridoxal phosphate-dependent decarboxylase family protein [Amycolatopsis sp. NPDC057786]|uniref:pyridoxal phosphate-dependent decarboxylase family protein n=1 Tax=Amycolatopsis sp. NPDC057786 TaxID=3346250 RepID=UPI00366E15A1